LLLNSEVCIKIDSAYKDECRRNKSYVDYFQEHIACCIRGPGSLEISSDVLDLSSETAGDNQEILLGLYQAFGLIPELALYFPSFYL
jgi:hypothetical protein